MNILFHCCCAPCVSSCINSLRNEGLTNESFGIDLFWYNPNIHPYTEYRSRLKTLAGYAAKENIKLKMIDEYGLRTFLKEVPDDLSARCKKCYRIRLEETAAAAAREGYASFSTSLLVSPYQDHDAIKRIGEETAAKYGINFFYRDFRPFFREGQAQARAGGMYMQKYCGCIFSEEERYSQKGTYDDPRPKAPSRSEFLGINPLGMNKP